jgi:hypothetical protein
MEVAEEIDLGFSSADAEDVQFTYKGGKLVLQFIDWTEKPIKVMFSDVVASKWQEAESLGPEERDDMTYIINNSKWLALHVSQNYIQKNQEYRHLKINFNACGSLEVLCKDATVKT